MCMMGYRAPHSFPCYMACCLHKARTGRNYRKAHIASLLQDWEPDKMCQSHHQPYNNLLSGLCRTRRGRCRSMPVSAPYECLLRCLFRGCSRHLSCTCTRTPLPGPSCTSLTSRSPSRARWDCLDYCRTLIQNDPHYQHHSGG